MALLDVLDAVSTGALAAALALMLVLGALAHRDARRLGS